MLKIDIHKNVAFVILDRPDVHNAFNDELVKHVTEALPNWAGVTRSASSSFGGMENPFAPAPI